MHKKVKKINLLAFTLVLMLGAFNIELALAEEIQIDRQTFSLKPDLTYKIFKGNSHSSGQVVNQASGITFLKAQPPPVLSHSDPAFNARYCGNCQVLYDSSSKQYFAIFPRFTLGLKLGVNLKELRAELEQIAGIDIQHINDNFAWLFLRHQKKWLSVYEELQNLQVYTRFILPEIKSHLAQVN